MATMSIERLRQIEKIAVEEAAMSQCNKRKVGAVIVNDTGGILGRGHNYNPTGHSCEDCDGLTKPEVIHAEIAAINDTVDINGADTIFVTHPPCEDCQRAIDKLGLTVKIVNSFMKFDNGKLRYGLIPPQATKALAEVLTYGAKKYKPDNWKQGEPDRYMDALYRHLEAYRSGELVDSESGLSHLSHAITNIAFLIYFERTQTSQI